MPVLSRHHMHPLVPELEEDDAAVRPPSRSWLDRAACVDVAISVFYPDDDGDLVEALLICGRCPVRADCLQHAIAARERYGIWGGTTPEERRRLMSPEFGRVGGRIDRAEEAS